jgi:hypothetical protein
MTDSSQGIVACVTAATVATYAGNVSGGKPVTIKPLIGGFIAGTLLLGVGMWSGQVALMFSVVMLVTSILINGTDLFKSFERLTK